MVSVIMPCYNASKTIEEAIFSILGQGAILQELIVVDDGSTDNTIHILRKIKSKNKKVRILSQSKNYGGGSARNLGIENCSTEVFMCFDADDILPAGMLSLLYESLVNSEYDGACFSRGFSFKKNKMKGNFVDWAPPGSVCEITDFFSGRSFPVGGVFMMYRKSWKLAGMYPVDNNFDTQGFGLRFLAKGLKAIAVPNAWFYQRQFSGTASYFEIAYRNGEYSLGFLCNIIDLWPILTESAKSVCLTFPFSIENDFSKNIVNRLNELQVNNNLFNKTSCGDSFDEARQNERIGQWRQAFLGYSNLLVSFPKSPLLEYLVIRSLFSIHEERTLRPKELVQHIKHSLPVAISGDPFRMSLFGRLNRKWKLIIQKFA